MIIKLPALHINACINAKYSFLTVIIAKNKMLSYCRETMLKGALVLARSGRLELGDNNLRTL